MATQSEFINTPVAVLNRSAFNKSHQNLLTMKVGTLTPVLVDELIPDTTIDLRATALAKLPPLASDTFMRVKMHLEAFFVPFRVLYGGYTYAMTGQETNAGNPGSSSPNMRRAVMPRLHVTQTRIGATSSAFDYYFGPGTLADYLGFKCPIGNSWSSQSPDFDLNIFPFLAYHRIYDDFYRSAVLQRPAFIPYPADAGYDPDLRTFLSVAWLPYTIAYGGGNVASAAVNPNVYRDVYLNDQQGFDCCDDAVRITDLRQRNFGHDYFTSASPSPTIGTTPTLVAPVSGNAASFTIGALRSVNSLTQFAERNALAGVRYSDWLKSNYGVELSEQVEGRAQYLGRMVFDVYSKGVSQSSPSYTDEDTTAGTPTPGDIVTQNPFKTVGAQYGNAVGVAEDTLCENFYVREPGILMVIASLVPRPTYSTGMARYLRHYTKDGFRGDLANQMLENVGPQPIYKTELDGHNVFGTSPDAIFGYTDRFAEYKTKFDEVHGLLRDGETLDSFALQRSVGLSGAVLGSSFLQIPTSYLDQVAAVNGDISKYGCWMDVAFDYKVVQPLSRYSQPSLVMPAEHGSKGHTEIVKRSGSYL